MIVPYFSLQTFAGSILQNDVVINWLESLVVARFVQINPQAWNTGICLRINFYGCPLSGRFGVTIYISCNPSFDFLFLYAATHMI